jgi:uncharacterized repeat protein (TIGR01451 family)
LVSLDASVRADGASSAAASHTAAIDDNNALTLALDENKDTVAPGEQLVYTLTYGNRSAVSVTGAVLSLPLPSGATFVSASGGGAEANGVVTWPATSLSVGQVSRQQVTVAVSGALANGTVIAVDAAQLAGTSTNNIQELARATNATRVIVANPIRLSSTLTPNPVSPTVSTTSTLTGNLTVTNTTGLPLTGVVLIVRYPGEHVGAVTPANLTPAGAVCSGNQCARNDLVTWTVGTIDANSAVTFNIPMPVYNATYAPYGSLIVLDAEVKTDTGAQATASDTAAVGTGSF